MSDIEKLVPDEEEFIQEPSIDIFADEDSKNQLLDYLANEIEETTSDSGRGVRMDRNKIIQRQRLARPEEEEKSFPWENACFSKEVDILTEFGWKKVKDVEVGEKVLTREPFSGKAYYTPVEKVYEFDPPEEGLIKIKNLFMDIDVTANHRFLVENKNKTLTKEVMAIDIMKGFEGQTNYYVPLTSEQENTEAISFFGYDPLDFMSLLGWYISEGWAYKHNCIGIAQSEEANPENVQEIKELLDRLGLHWTFNGSAFLIDIDSQVVDNLRILGRSWEKFIPRMYLETSREQLSALFNALLKGDGSVHWDEDKHRNYPSITYTTVSKQLANDFQELVTKLGYSGKISAREAVEGGIIKGRRISGKRAQYTISVRFTKRTRFRKDRCTVEWVDYDDKVYCVDVPPKHTIYVRQNGMPVWTMNSNVTPPIALQKTNLVVTRILNKLTTKSPLLQYEAVAPYKKHAQALTRFVDKLIESPYGIDLYSKLWTIVYETVSLGTEFVKVPFIIDRLHFNRKTGDGSEQKVDRIIRACPDVVHIPFEDFLTRPHWDNISKAPWVGVRYYKYRHELEALAAQGFYSNVDIVLQNASKLDEHKKEQKELLGVDALETGIDNNDIFTVYEVNVYWDVDGDGFAEDIIVHFEKETKTLLRVEYNDLGVRDYVRIPHIEIPNSLYGLGVGDILIPIQDEVEALHNMRNDATQLAILPIVVTSESSKFGAKQELYPGKFIKTPVPREDIIIHKFPDVGPASLNAERFAQEYADQATGASDALSGKDVGGSNRIGAQGTQFLAAQSLGYIDAISSQMDKKIAEIGMLILYQLVKNSDYVDLSILDEGDQVLVAEILNLNVEDIPSKFKFRARLSNIIDSPAQKQQEALQLLQVYMAYGDKIAQLSAQMANPQMAQVPRVTESLQTYFVGLTSIMEKILESFDEDNVDDYLPFIKDLEFILRQADEQRSEEIKQNEARTEGGAAQEGAVPLEEEGSGQLGGVEAEPAAPIQGAPESNPGGPTIGGPAI